MDNYISNDPNNPINYNGKDVQQCNICQNDLNTTEEQEQKLCFECIEEQERKELEKQFLKFPELEETKEREVLNNIFNSFSTAIIGSFDKDGNLI